VLWTYRAQQPRTVEVLRAAHDVPAGVALSTSVLPAVSYGYAIGGPAKHISASHQTIRVRPGVQRLAKADRVEESPPVALSWSQSPFNDLGLVDITLAGQRRIAAMLGLDPRTARSTTG
jgi:hypothetical protein